MMIRKFRRCAPLVLIAILAGCNLIGEDIDGAVAIDFQIDDSDDRYEDIVEVDTESFAEVTVTSPWMAPLDEGEIEVRSSDSRVVEVREWTRTSVTENAIGSTQVFTVRLRGVGVGRAIITARGEGNVIGGVPAPQVEIEVVPPRFTIAIAPPSLNILVNQTATLSCTVTNALTGLPVLNPALEWISLNGVIATVATDGTVTGKAVGSTDVGCRIAGTNTFAVAQVTVTAPETGPPAPSALGGAYGRSGPKLNDTCPAGIFDEILTGGIESGVTEDDGVITFTMFTETEVRGSYDPATGNWSGVGSKLTTFQGTPALLVQRLSGWFENGRPIVLIALMTYEYRSPVDGSLLCSALYDAKFTKSR